MGWLTASPTNALPSLRSQGTTWRHSISGSTITPCFSRMPTIRVRSFGSEKEQVIRAGEFAIARKIVVIRVRPKRGFLGLMFVKQLGAIEALAGQWHGIRNIGIRSSVFRARLENPFPVRHVFPHERGRKPPRLPSPRHALPAGRGHQNFERIACRLCREVLRPAQDVVAPAVPYTIQAEQDSLADVPRLLLQSQIQVTLHLRDKRFNRLLQQLPGSLGWLYVASRMTASAARSEER